MRKTRRGKPLPRSHGFGSGEAEKGYNLSGKLDGIHNPEGLIDIQGMA